MIKSNQLLGYDSSSRLCLVLDLHTNTIHYPRPTEAVTFKIYEPGVRLSRKIEAQKANTILYQKMYQRQICNSTRHNSNKPDPNTADTAVSATASKIGGLGRFMPFKVGGCLEGCVTRSG